MSILIKGMEMPKNCVECGVYWNGCPVWNLENIDKDYSEKRAPNCPLVPVSPHGRLIDADALTRYYTDDGYPVYDWYDVKDAPTIIEAEGTNDGN